MSSPLTEKLAAILDDWDQLSSVLTDVQQQCAAKDGAIAGLQQTIATQQQQLNKQASELSALKNQLASLQAQATAALLTSQDPDDAKIKQRIETAFQSVAAKPMIVPAPPSANAGQGPVRPATPTVFSDTSTAGSSIPRAAVNGNGRLVIPGRTGVASNGTIKPPPQPQPTHTQSSPLSLGKTPQAAGGSAGGSSRYSSSDDAS